MLVCLSCASILIAAHFWLLETYTASVIALIASVRFTTAIFSRSKIWMLVFLGLIMATALATFDGVTSVLVTAASSISTVGAFQSSDQRFRLLMMLATLLMVVHNLIIKTPAGVLLELFFFGSNCVGYYRHYLRGYLRDRRR